MVCSAAAASSASPGQNKRTAKTAECKQRSDASLVAAFGRLAKPWQTAGSDGSSRSRSSAGVPQGTRLDHQSLRPKSADNNGHAVSRFHNMTSVTEHHPVLATVLWRCGLAQLPDLLHDRNL